MFVQLVVQLDKKVNNLEFANLQLTEKFPQLQLITSCQLGNLLIYRYTRETTPDLVKEISASDGISSVTIDTFDFSEC